MSARLPVEAADIVAAQTVGAFHGGHAQRLRGAERGGAVRKAIQQQSLAGFRQHVGAVIGGAAVHPQAHRRAGAAQCQGRGDAGAEPHVGAGAMRHSHAGAAQAGNFARG